MNMFMKTVVHGMRYSSKIIKERNKKHHATAAQNILFLVDFVSTFLAIHQILSFL